MVCIPAKILLAATLATFSGSSIMAQAAAPEIFAPGVISGPANDLSPAFTPDGRAVFFTRSNSSQSTITISHRSGGTWSKPEIASFSGEWRDLEPTMAPDGSYLVFISNRPAASGGKPLDGFYNGAAQPAAGGNLWRVDRTARGWGEPRRLPDVVNSNTSIYSPSIAADGSIYFMQPTGAKTRFHLFRAEFSNGTFATPVAVPVSAGEDVGDYDPAVAPDESFMVFSSARLPDKGTSLFIARRRNGVWSTPEYMGDTVSIPHAGNIEARLGPDHRTLYFSSTHVDPALPHQDRAQSERGLDRMAAWNDGLANIWRVSLSPWLAR
jgi:Tol biopolymer transport system component